MHFYAIVLEEDRLSIQLLLPCIDPFGMNDRSRCLISLSSAPTLPSQSSPQTTSSRTVSEFRGVWSRIESLRVEHSKREALSHVSSFLLRNSLPSHLTAVNGCCLKETAYIPSSVLCPNDIQFLKRIPTITSNADETNRDPTSGSMHTPSPDPFPPSLPSEFGRKKSPRR